MQYIAWACPRHVVRDFAVRFSEGIEALGKTVFGISYQLHSKLKTERNELVGWVITFGSELPGWGIVFSVLYILLKMVPCMSVCREKQNIVLSEKCIIFKSKTYHISYKLVSTEY